MKCPNNNDCEIVFFEEVNDNGDPSTPYFESYVIYLYDSENSEHSPNCPGLTEEQIEALEKIRNDEPLEYNYD